MYDSQTGLIAHVFTHTKRRQKKNFIPKERVLDIITIHTILKFKTDNQIIVDNGQTDNRQYKT